MTITMIFEYLLLLPPQLSLPISYTNTNSFYTNHKYNRVARLLPSIATFYCCGDTLIGMNRSDYRYFCLMKAIVSVFNALAILTVTESKNISVCFKILRYLSIIFSVCSCLNIEHCLTL